MKEILYNPCYTEYKRPLGAAKNGDNIFIAVKIIEKYCFDFLRLLVKNDDNEVVISEKMTLTGKQGGYQIYQIVFTIPKTGLYWYCFEFADFYGRHFIGADSELNAVLTDYKPACWQLTVCGEFIGKLDWFKGKIMYQIMVDRFYRGKETPIKPDVIFHENW